MPESESSDSSLGHDESTMFWLKRLEARDEQATERLWREYYTKLVHLARRKLVASKKRIADEEDLAAQVIENFCRSASEQRFPKLNDRDDLWRLLFTITDRMAKRALSRERRLKRGGGKVRGNSAFDNGADSQPEGIEQFALTREPTPDEAQDVSDAVEELLKILPEPALRDVAIAKMNGFTNDEIAEQSGCSARTIKRRLQRIRTCWQASIPDLSQP